MSLCPDTHRIRFTDTRALVVEDHEIKPEPEGKLGSAEELRPSLEQLKLALASEEPLPCLKILKKLSQSRWSDGHETALAEVNRLVKQYRLAEALAFLDKEFDDVMN